MIGRNCFVQKSFCAKKKNFIAQFIDVVFLLLRLRVPLDVSNNIVSERERKRAKNCSNQKRIVTKLTRSTLKIQSFSTEHSPMGEASQYNWSPVLQVWIQLLHYKQKTAIFLVKSSLVKLEASRIVILLPTVSVLWFQPISHSRVGSKFFVRFLCLWNFEHFSFFLNDLPRDPFLQKLLRHKTGVDKERERLTNKG